MKKSKLTKKYKAFTSAAIVIRYQLKMMTIIRAYHERIYVNAIKKYETEHLRYRSSVAIEMQEDYNIPRCIEYERRDL